MKEHVRQHFRWAPHTGGASAVKPRDFEEAGTVEARSPYEAWNALRSTENPLRIGDLLEDDAGALRVYKYVGFEEAHWALAELEAVTGSANAALAVQPAAGSG